MITSLADEPRPAADDRPRHRGPGECTSGAHPLHGEGAPGRARASRGPSRRRPRPPHPSGGCPRARARAPGSTASGTRRPRAPAPRRPRSRPRPGRPPAPTAASSASVPRTTSSWSFVSSRHTAARRSAPKRARHVGERPGDPRRRLEEHHRARLGGSAPKRGARSPGLRGRNPSNVKRSVGRPGEGERGRAPRSDRGSRSPSRPRDRRGDEPVTGVGDGRHAGVAQHQDVAVARRARRARGRAPSRCGRAVRSAAGGWRSPSAARSRCVVRVSSAAMTLPSSSASIRRREASPRFPIGVAARMITAPACAWRDPAERRRWTSALPAATLSRYDGGLGACATDPPIRAPLWPGSRRRS